MRTLLRVHPAAGTHVLDSDGAHVGTVIDADSDAKYVSVHQDAPSHTLDALDWDADADRARLPDALVATEDEDGVHLVV
ncbi:MAG: hypothetical protein ABEH83_02835 [Halobacterium sp.]